MTRTAPVTLTSPAAPFALLGWCLDGAHEGSNVDRRTCPGAIPSGTRCRCACHGQADG